MPSDLYEWQLAASQEPSDFTRGQAAAIGEGVDRQGGSPWLWFDGGRRFHAWHGVFLRGHE
ncbi:MAG: hypothetical protein ACR2NU_08025 [Aeoliella sp.]